jgi:hypothetical protein
MPAATRWGAKLFCTAKTSGCMERMNRELLKDFYTSEKPLPGKKKNAARFALLFFRKCEKKKKKQGAAFEKGEALVQ